MNIVDIDIEIRREHFDRAMDLRQRANGQNNAPAYYPCKDCLFSQAIMDALPNLPKDHYIDTRDCLFFIKAIHRSRIIYKGYFDIKEYYPIIKKFDYLSSASIDEATIKSFNFPIILKTAVPMEYL